MDYINNKGEKIGSLTNAVSNDRSITINRIHDVTIVSTRDRNTGEVTTASVALADSFFAFVFPTYPYSYESEPNTGQF